MSDIIISRKMGEGAVARPQASTATTSTLGTIASAPAGLANAAVGTLIKALVVSQTARGFTTLQTDKGVLTLQTHVPLKSGSEVILQVQTSGPQTLVQILSVDRQPPAAGSAQTLFTAAVAHPGAEGGKTAPAKGTPVPAAGTRTDPSHGHSRGAPLAGAQDHAARGAGAGERASPLSVGAVVPGRITVAGSNGIATVVLRTNAPAASGTPLSLPTGTTLALRVLNVGGTETGQARGPAVPPSGDGTSILKARIVDDGPARPGVGNTARTVMLAVGDARVAVAATASASAGTEVMLEVLDARMASRSAGAEAPYSTFLRLGTEWKSLKEVIALQPALETARSPIENVVPRPGPQLASGLLFFMSALGAGSLRSWLGDVRAEVMAQAGHGLLLSRLAEDFTQMARYAADTQGTGWHALAVPVQTGAHTEQLRVFYRRHQGSGRDGDGATHFMVEAELSRIGLFQLEGLVRPRHFDLAVHSATALDSTMQGAIREIFQEALSTGELAGTIRFEVGDNTPFNPPGISREDHAATLTA